MFRTLTSLGRLARAGITLARYDAIFPREYQEKFPPTIKAFAAFTRLFSRRGEAENPGERLARALEKLGPTYVKFGQVLATRADVVGQRFARGLSRLQDQMPAFDQKIAISALEKELGGELADWFVDFKEPVNAASVAQVHRATTIDGRDVAVKILRPGVEQRLAKDIRAMQLGAKLVQRFVPATKRMEPVKFVDTVARATELETDLRLEAASASELAEAATLAENYCVPDVDWERSGKRVLTTSWVEGIPLTDIDRIDDAGIDREALANTLTRAFLTTAMETGVFHADMHAGNLFVDLDGNLWAVDFGIMGRIGREERRFLALILHGFLTRDYKGAAEAHFNAGYVPPRHSIDDFASALRAVGEPIFGKQADEVPMSRVLLQLFEITALFEMHLRPELILLQKTMVQSEGVARLLNPQHDMWGASAPVVEKWMKRELGPEGMALDFVDDLKRLRVSAKRLPGAIEDWAEAGARLRSGEIKLDEASLNRLAGQQREGRLWRWLGYGILAAAAGAAGASLYTAL